eukprot:188550-Prorocentrum_minimum.AAC.1
MCPKVVDEYMEDPAGFTAKRRRQAGGEGGEGGAAFVIPKRQRRTSAPADVEEEEVRSIFPSPHSIGPHPGNMPPCPMQLVPTSMGELNSRVIRWLNKVLTVNVTVSRFLLNSIQYSRLSTEFYTLFPPFY